MHYRLGLLFDARARARANLELAFAFALEGDTQQFIEYAGLDAELAPQNTKMEFLAFCSTMGFGYRARARTLKAIGFQHEDLNEVVSRLWETYLLEWPRDSIPYEETMPLLDHLKDQYKLGLITNFVDGPTARKVLEKYRFDEIFDVIVISGEEGYRKPKRTLFDKALSGLKSQPEYSIMIGDTLIADVVGPKEIGMKAILVDENGSKKESHHFADAVVSNISEVKDVITVIL